MLNLVKKNDESYQPEANEIMIEADVFYRAMQAYRFANDDDTRLNLQCVKLIVSKASLRVVATDGHALLIFDSKIGYDDVRFEAYIDRDTAKQLCSVLKKNRNENLRIEKTSNGLKLSLPNQSFDVEHRVVFEDFPPYEKVIPDDVTISEIRVALGILQLERVAAYLKAVFEPAKKSSYSESTLIKFGEHSLAPVTFESEGLEASVKIVQMPTRV